MNSAERVPGKPNTLIGTDGYLKYAKEKTNIKDFINRYKKK